MDNLPKKWNHSARLMFSVPAASRSAAVSSRAVTVKFKRGERRRTHHSGRERQCSKRVRRLIIRSPRPGILIFGSTIHGCSCRITLMARLLQVFASLRSPRRRMVSFIFTPSSLLDSLPFPNFKCSSLRTDPSFVWS